MMSVLRAALICSLVVGCSSQRPPGSNGGASGTSAPSASAPTSPVAPSSVAAADAGAPPDAIGRGGPRGDEVSPEAAAPTFDETARILFADRGSFAGVTAACPSSTPPDARIRCLFDERYRGDARSASLAHELFVKWRIVAGVEVAHTMNGGYRGMIRIEPALPVAKERKHIEWIAAAMRDFDEFFSELERHSRATPADGRESAARRVVPKRYRFKPITLRFMRSVAARTPSAYAHDWTVAWNLAGSLHTSSDAVRETLFHEIFHLNDYAHPPAGGEAWSFDALGSTFDAVVKKCGTAIPCLGPYSPNDTVVRGGTYYSFQPGNGVREYAAELALRYYREQRAAIRSLAKPKAFKCGPPENARAWALMRDEFFGGVDVVPPCGS